MMTRRDFETLLLTLESTPALLARAAASFSGGKARMRPARGGFSFVENIWHLADLEREGYGNRIDRILTEENPALSNFDGDALARERGYQDRDVERGLALFTRAGPGTSRNCAPSPARTGIARARRKESAASPSPTFRG